MDSIEVADVFRQFGPSYIETFGAAMPPSHRRAISDIMACRTPAMGGHAYRCEDCGQTFFAYHGCRNRSCPACHTAQTRQWLERRQAELFPCTYYHVCVTVPAALRAVFRSNQKDCYALLMQAASQSVLALCADNRYMGGVPAILSVLHTWTAAMDYHPHVHLLVSGGGIGPDGASWREAQRSFLLPVRALSRLVRGKFMDGLGKTRPDLAKSIAQDAWKGQWVAWCKPWGQGETAVLDYLARYVHRIAITNRRILAMDEKTVTFRYKDRKTGQWRTRTLSGHEFMRRFLQHVLPKGFHKVRYAGLWHGSRKAQRETIRTTLRLTQPRETPGPQPSAAAAPATGRNGEDDSTNPPCPHCGSRRTAWTGTVPKAHARINARAAP